VRWLVYLILVWLAVLLQSTVPAAAELAGQRAGGWGRLFFVIARIDWILLTVVWFGMNADRRSAGLCGWGLGMAADAFSVGPMGLHAILYFVVAHSIAGRRRLIAQRPVTIALTTFIVVLLMRLMVPPILSRFGDNPMPVPWGRAFSAALFTGLAAPLIAAGLQRCRTGWDAKR